MIDAESSGARAKLHAILTSPEFTARENTWIRDRVNKALAWIVHQLDRLFGKMPKTPDVSPVALKVMLLCAIGVALYFLARRFLLRPSAATPVPEHPFAAESRRVWREFAKHAAEAAARDDYREAVRLAYWAGVYRLEELGVWRADRNRTHREYLRLLPEDSARRAPLAAITQRFELAWYAGQSASAEEFQEVAQRLAELGCPLPLAAKS